MTGLFANLTRSHRGPGRQYLARRKDPGLLDRFAECLSEHGDVSRAAAEVGKSASYGRVLLARIKKRLGPQAQ